MMHFNSIILPALFTIVRAADDGIQLTYATATITQCFTQGGLAVPTVTVVAPSCIIKPPAVTGGPIIVEVQAPDCDCGCPTCVQTLEYTTRYPAFCSTGLYDQEYVITETYKGMEAKPTMDHDLPFGFTYDVQTCTTCGPEAVTATITYPVSDRPYINHVTYPTEKPIAVKPIDSENGYEVPEDSKSEDKPDYPGGQKGSYQDDPYFPGAQENSRPETEPYNPQGPTPAEGSDNKPQGEAAPKVPAGDNHGFQSSVRPSSAADYPESAHPGECDKSSNKDDRMKKSTNVSLGIPSELPVVVSGAAGRDLGLAGVAIVVAVVFESLFSL